MPLATRYVVSHTVGGGGGGAALGIIHIRHGEFIFTSSGFTNPVYLPKLC